MKKRKMLNNRIGILLVFLCMQFGFSQKIIEKPEYGSSTLPGEITKVEILENETILHFHLSSRPSSGFSVPKGSCIVTNESDEKLFVTKADGVNLNKGSRIPESGVIDYKLYFPAVSKSAGTMDFMESNKGGSWYVYDIVIDETQFASVLPKKIKGNWLKADGSNLWAYSFYNDCAIVDNKIWKYKCVKEKRKYSMLLLEREGETKKIYAKVNGDKTISFGTDRKQLVACCLKRLKISDTNIKGDLAYKESDLFRSDSTTYSGVIKNYGKRIKNKTGMLHVNNVFTGKQDSYMVHIQEDGSFTVKFPLRNPQKVFVRLPGYYGAVYFEPGKEIWQLINSAKTGDVYFSGDCAQLNTDLLSLQFIKNYREYGVIMKSVGELIIEDYKERLDKVHVKQIQKLDSEIESRFISERAQQIMRLELEYQNYQYVVSYDMYRGDRFNPKVNAEYLSFITPEVYDNKLAVIADDYYNFLNRLRYTSVLFSRERVKSPRNIELAKILNNKGIELTVGEKELIVKIEKFKLENIALLQKKVNYHTKNKNQLEMFSEKLGRLYGKSSKAERLQVNDFLKNDMNELVKLGDSYGIEFSAEEIRIKEEYNQVLTKKEQGIIDAFYLVDNKIKIENFNKKYIIEANAYVSTKMIENRITKIDSYFGQNTYWTVDLLKSEIYSRRIISELSPFSNAELEEVLHTINDSLAKKYLVYENERIIKKLENNKNATGYVLNETPNTEADKVFDAIISKYKGKVVFVDFWATWCAPCLSGIKKMVPLKEELENEDIVFLFITDQSSPEETYNNMIPTIKGEHYRVSTDEWNYLKIKFKISGIPHYSIVNKEGKVVENNIRLGSNEDYKRVLKKHL